MRPKGFEPPTFWLVDSTHEIAGKKRATPVAVHEPIDLAGVRAKRSAAERVQRGPTVKDAA